MSEHDLTRAAAAEAVDYDPFAAGRIDRVVPTTEAQQEVWLADRAGHEASLAYNEAIRMRLSGPLDRAALVRALDRLAERHESLRATISPDGMTMLLADSVEVEIREVDLTGAPDEAREDALERERRSAVETRFDIESGPLFRIALLALGGDAFELIFAAHHIVCDGWSFGVLARDLARLYDAERGLPLAPLAPADTMTAYSAREAQQRHGSVATTDERFWSDLFAGGAPTLDLPTDRPRPRRRTFASRREDRMLDPALLAEIKRFSGRQGVGPFAVVWGAVATLLARIAGQSEIVLGIPVAGQAAASMPALVGHCVNLLPVRFSPDPGADGAAMVRAAQSVLFDALEHQEYTFGTLLRRITLKRDPSRPPLVAAMFNLDQALGIDTGFSGLRVVVDSIPRVAENFELFINAAQIDGGLRLECQYSTDLFDRESIRHWLASLEQLLRGLVATPDRPIDALPLLDDGQRAELDRWNDTAMEHDPRRGVHEMVAAQALRSPHAAAVLAGRSRLTYAELDARSSRIAGVLHALGVRPGDRVGLCLERGIELVPALLAVLRAGAAYVPLDPGFPAERLAFMVEDAGLKAILTDSRAASVVPASATATLLIDDESDWPVPADSPVFVVPSNGEEVAYVIYTSGSTGRPKGVAVPHRAVANFLESMRREPGLTGQDRLVAVTTLSFDIAVLELLLPLCVGGSVVIASRAEVVDGHALRAVVESSGATALQATPAGWRLLLDAGWAGAAGFKALVGGEALPVDLAAALLERCGEVWNMYGPTETTVWSTTWRVTSPERGISIGRPIGNTRVHVLDAGARPVPIGVAGELYIGGAGVATGYFGRPELTRERFVEDPFDARPEARLYRTGDLGRWRADGRLEHLGRLDSQVKLRGYRIELGEIETVMRTHPAVADAVAIVREDQPGDQRLVAYAVSREEPREPGSDITNLAVHLKRHLPDYMVPKHVVCLRHLPRLPNGKLDSRSLPAPDGQSTQSTEHESPATETERIVAAVMEKCLGLRDLGRRDDFFSLGGHSLLAAQVITQLNRQLGLRLTMGAMFESPTVAGLARAIDRAAAPAAGVANGIAPRAERSVAPLSLNQERLVFLERLQPGRTVYNTPSAHRLRGRLDPIALGRAFQSIVDRHDVLRTVVEHTPAGPIQRIHPTLDVSTLPLEDLSSIEADLRESVAMERIEHLVETPFDLSRLPLFVIRLYRLSSDEHLLFFMPHHLIWDGWSFDLFYEEMSAGYFSALEGRAADLPKLEISYGDYAAWQRAWVESAEFGQQLGRWRNRFEATIAQPKRPLMTDRERGASMSGEGRTEWLEIDRTLTERLREFARDSDATMFMTLLSAYVASLASLGAVGRQLIGLPVRGRSTTETEPLMGYFTNLLPLQITVSLGDTFRVLQDRVRRGVMDAFAFPDVPLERMMQEMPELRGAGPLYQALFSFQDARQRPIHWGNLRHERVEVAQRGATEDLGLWLVERNAGLVGGITYHTDLYDTSSARRLRERFVALLRKALESPDASVDTLLALDATERVRLEDWIGSGAATVADRSESGSSAETRVTAPADPKSTRTEPATETERRIAAIWSGLLGIERVYREDNFFDLGGHSLLVMQSVETLEAELHRRIDPRRYIFESLAQIAAGYDTAPPLEAPKRGLLNRLFGGRRSA